MRAAIHHAYRVRLVRSNWWRPGSGTALPEADLPRGVEHYEVTRQLTRHRRT